MSQILVAQNAGQYQTVLERQLIESVKNSLRMELYNNAAFLCERLMAVSSMDGEDAKLMLAESYIGEGKSYKAYEVLKNCQQPESRYKHALTCIKLKKYSEAERALLGGRGKFDLKNVPNGAAGFYLLAQTQELQNKAKDAVKNYKIALEKDPTLWCAFDRLCKLNPTEVEPHKIFREDHIAILSLNQQIQNTHDPKIQISPLTSLKKEIPSNETKENQMNQKLVLKDQQSTSNLVARGDVSMQDASSNSGEAEEPVVANELKTPPLPGSQFITPSSGQFEKIKHAQHPQFGPAGVIANRNKLIDESISSLNFQNAIGSSHGEGIVRPFCLNSGTPTINQKIANNTPQSNPVDATVTHFQIQDQVHQGDTLMNLLRLLGDAVQLMNKFQCCEAEAKFKKLTKKQQETGYIQQCVARCLFEQVRYNDCVKCYEKMIKLEPYRLEGLEYFSTCLWQLKRQSDLVHLANYCIERCRDCAETNCVVGNLFSLQREHETALKHFLKASLIDQNFAYAYTLAGHEYVANEDYERAKKSFQSALNADPRHYNALWGLGNICYKQENYEHADQYFEQATEINDRLATLWTYRGMALHNSQSTNKALKCFDKAEKIDPKNPLNKYQRGNVLMTLERYQEALEVFQDLAHFVPKEAPVQISIGKIYKKLGRQDLALQAFNKALDLDPKDTNMVKTLIDKLDLNDDASEDAEIEI